MSIETEAVERFLSAINRNDMQTVTDDFDPEVERIEFEGSPNAGVFRGIAEVRECIRKGRGSWAEGTCEAEQLLQNGDKVVVYAHARVRLHGASEWIGGRFADGFAFRNGRIVQYHSFTERSAALKWADIED